MVKNMQYCPGLSRTDYVILRFDLACYTVRHESQDLRLDYNRADFDKLNDLIRKADCSMTTDTTLGVEARYTAFKIMLNTLVERSVPTAKPKSKKKNIYINRAATKLKKRKRALWQEYKHSKDPICYALYVRCRNDLRALTRKLRRDFEQSLACTVKANP